MPFPVTCRCGRSFLAPDALAGQQSRCPACGGVIDIPGGASLPRPPVVVACACGQRFQAPAHLIGQHVRCPVCGGGLVVAPESGEGLSMATQPAPMHSMTPANYSAPRPASAASGGVDLTRWVYIACGVAGVVLLGLFVAILVSSFRKPTSNVASPNTASPDLTAAASVDAGVPAPAESAPAGSPPPVASLPRGYPRLPGTIESAPAWLFKDAPFDVAALFRAPPPERNAANYYLDALFEFGPDVGMCFSKTERQSRLPIAQQRQSRIKDIHARWTSNPAGADAAELDSLLQELDTGFRQLAAAQAHTECVFQTSLGPLTLLPHVQSARDAAKALSLRAHREIARGDIVAALRTLETLLRLSRDERRRQGMVTHLVSLALTNAAVDEIAVPIMAHAGFRKEHCDRLIAIAKHHDELGRNQWEEMIRNEYVSLAVILHDFQHRTETLQPANVDYYARTGKLPQATMGFVLSHAHFGQVTDSVGLKSAQMLDKLSNIYRPEDYQREWTALIRTTRELLRVKDDTVVNQMKVGPVCSAMMKEEKAVIMQLFTPPTSTMATAIGWNTAKWRALLCFALLRRSQFDSGQPATDLAQAVRTAGLKQVPIDPYTRMPLKLAVMNGETVIYSFGPDGADDQARFEAPRAKNEPGDFVFRIPAAARGG